MIEVAHRRELVHTARADYLHPALGPGPTTTVGLRSVSRGRRRAVGASRRDSDGWDQVGRRLQSTPTIPVTWQSPYRGAFLALTVTAARLEDREADPENVPSGHNRD